MGDAKTSDVLSRMPELRPSQTTWLWEYQKFLPSINDLYKVYVPKNTSITVIVSYNDTKYATRITANTEVLSLINYNDYVSWLYGTYTGSFKTVGTNYFGGLSYQYLAGSYISNLKSTSNSYYILSINNSYLSDAYTFTYNISLDFNDYIDNNQTFPNNNFVNATDYIRINNNYRLYTNSSDSDYFKITPVSKYLPQ